MRTVLLVPRRDDRGHRDALWRWCRARWEAILPDVPIYEGHHVEGPFNRSAAINLAAKLADDADPWDVAVVIDADIFIRRSQVQAAIERAVATGRVTWAHRRWRGLAPDWTARVVGDGRGRDFGPDIEDEDMDLLVERTNPISWSCCIAIPRPVWDDMGGYDERFVGWGFEDMAFQSVVCGLFGHERIEGDVYHLWHPRSEERIVKGQPGNTATAEYVVNARLGRRYMVALRRDHGLHDRPGLPVSDDERERDIANLKADDAKLASQTRALQLPDWSTWWPSLDELVAGAKAHRAGPESSVTVIVHTGGEPDTWAERSGYLRMSLASLADRVGGPIVQRVVYSDWGEEHRAELDAIAGAHGFYVVGEGHQGYTGSTRAMWRYLARRAKGEYVFQAEDDFVYDRDVDLARLIDVLEHRPYLSQVALLRHPAYAREVERGGILGWPDDQFRRERLNGHRWLEHRLFWTQNPSLFRRTLTGIAWPAVTSSERAFGDKLLRDTRVAFGLWGEGEAQITHIGAVRAARDY